MITLTSFKNLSLDRTLLRFTRTVSTSNKQKAIVTCSLNGVLTDPKKFPEIPVTPEQMADSALEAYNAGATVVHVHFRDQRPGKGHLPCWDPVVALECCDAIRRKAPKLVINLTTGTVGNEGAMGGGPLGPIHGPVSCLDKVRPEMAALNMGSLNYLKATNDGKWAWPPMLFDNTVPKVTSMIEAMRSLNIVPECECFDTGIVRSISLYEKVGLLKAPYQVSLVMGVASGMPAKPNWLPLLVDELPKGCHWQVIAIGRDDVWPLLRKTAELGGNVRTGLEDTLYLPSGQRANSNGKLIESLVNILREVGREPTSPEETKMMLSSS
eukprot:NODE_5152_length_1059_cov_26.736111_g4596_i0.p1 GENE.NODE_5152_length_1059_cov_26.736111_g4596_i0~~NODE_5152_length_1059_cov_26.736111_g4596_i0.p1  ORF type:complete len:341 (-),score=54.11 NODE_5152_length_1059_cov_26.736111_g4596_i0:37-1011(-)